MASWPSHTKLTMPSLSPTMQEGVIVRWFKKEGDAVKPGDTLFEVETDKATVGYEVQEDIVLAKILAPEGGAALAVGKPVAIMVDEAKDVAAFSNYTESPEASDSKPAAPKTEEPVPKNAAPKQEASQEPAKPKAVGDRVIASPLARLLSEELSVDLLKLEGTGPDGRIIKADVMEAHKKQVEEAKKPAGKEQAKPQVPAPSIGYRDVPHSGIRKVIASRLLEAKLKIPHYYLSADCEMDSLLA